jgi:hypothetical protein
MAFDTFKLLYSVKKRREREEGRILVRNVGTATENTHIPTTSKGTRLHCFPIDQGIIAHYRKMIVGSKHFPQGSPLLCLSSPQDLFPSIIPARERRQIICNAGIKEAYLFLGSDYPSHGR